MVNEAPVTPRCAEPALVRSEALGGAVSALRCCPESRDLGVRLPLPVRDRCALSAPDGQPQLVPLRPDLLVWPHR